MLIRQKSSRYNNQVLFAAGIAGSLLIAAAVVSRFSLDFEVWLACALVAALMLYARASFALSDAQRELEILASETKKFANMVGEEIKSSVGAETGAADGAAKEWPPLKFEAVEHASAADQAILDEVRAAIEAQRLDLYFQPIVSLPQRKYRFFEAFSRLRRADGAIIRPSHYIEAAERANRIGVIDNLILFRSIQALRSLGPESQHYRIFCNISPATIYDRDFFDRFADYLDANRDLASRLVFEFTYPAVELMSGASDKKLETIARRGFSFSLDNIPRFDLNWKSLRERNFRFVKCTSAMLLKRFHDRADGAGAGVSSFRAKLAEYGIDLIAEKIEYEAHVPDIVSMGIDFGQGDLFGPPRRASEYVESALAGDTDASGDEPQTAPARVA